MGYSQRLYTQPYRADAARIFRGRRRTVLRWGRMEGDYAALERMAPTLMPLEYWGVATQAAGFTVDFGPEAPTAPGDPHRRLVRNDGGWHSKDANVSKR